MPKLESDPRYKLLPNLKERRAAFDDFCKNVAAEQVCCAPCVCPLLYLFARARVCVCVCVCVCACACVYAWVLSRCVVPLVFASDCMLFVICMCMRACVRMYVCAAAEQVCSI